MNIDLKFLEPYLIYMIFAFLGLLILYIKTYTTEKAKMEVLKSENKKLIEETERIKKVSSQKMAIDCNLYLRCEQKF